MQTYGFDTLYNINFKENPEQLFGVFTSPENIARVQMWMEQYGFNPKQVYTFEEFLEEVKRKSQEIDNNFENSIRYNVGNSNRDYQTEELKKDGKSITQNDNWIK